MQRRPPPSEISDVYVGAIPFEWSEDQFKAVACTTGRVVGLRMGFDFVGKNKGFAFVEYESPQEAAKAMVVLQQINILLPGRPPRKLRVDMSKEATRDKGERKVFPFIPANLPPDAQIPAEVLAQATQFVPKLEPGPATQPLPDLILQKTQSLPLVAQLPFSNADKISETVGSIPPAQLLPLVANLKNQLAGPNPARAADVFQLSPDLAAALAQALLLMGFIDGEVIQESMKAAAVTQNAAPPFLYQLTPAAQYAPPPPPPKWPQFPQATQAKLAALAPDQAELVAQVLQLPQAQVMAMPPDQQLMIMNIRQQYL